MKSSAKKSQRVLTAIDTAVFAAAAAIFSLCILYVAVSMILKKPSPIYGYGAYDAYELIQRIGALLLVMVPFIMRKCRVMLPSAFTIAYNVFILISVFGGTFMGLYINTSWWDKFNHLLSGVLLGLAGMFFLNALTAGKSKVNAGGVLLYAVAFAVLCGVIWEIYEFTCDGLLGSNMQKFRNDHTLEEYVGRAALKDTMTDLILDSAGALAAGAFCAAANSVNGNFLRMFEIKILPAAEEAPALNDAKTGHTQPESVMDEAAATDAAESGTVPD